MRRCSTNHPRITRVGLEFGQCVEQRLVPAVLVELAEGFAANGVIGFEQSEQIAGGGFAEPLDCSLRGSSAVLFHPRAFSSRRGMFQRVAR
jgi:hypothetical protein